MNKILNINLGGYALTIDDDAFEYLHAYLESIRRRFSESEGRDEIISDIETRLGELITSSMGARNIVTHADVESAIAIMGKPEDFGAEPIDNQRRMGSSPSGGIRTGKRLMRDEETAIVGGICSGLSAYFGVEDPVWMRLIFVLLTIVSAGFWIPAYLLLWILVPAARNAAERLAMRGQPVNVNNIAREVEEGFERISNRVNEFGNETKKKTGTGAHSLSNAVSGGVSILGKLFGAFLQIFGRLIKFFLILGAIATVLVLAVVWTGGTWAFFSANNRVFEFSPLSEGVTYWGFTNLFLIIGLPIIALCIWLSHLIFKTKSPSWLGVAMVILWFVNVLSFGAVLGKSAQAFSEEASIVKTDPIIGLPSDTLVVEIKEIHGQLPKNQMYNGMDIRMSPWSIHIDNNQYIDVQPTNGSEFEITKEYFAFGNTHSEAQENANSIELEHTLTGNRLIIPEVYKLNEGKKWRGQHAKLKIKVPIGKFISLDRTATNHLVYDETRYSDRSEEKRFSRNPDRVFKMTANGLECLACPKFGDANYDIDENYENFVIEGNMKVEIKKADRFRVQYIGNRSLIDMVKVSRGGKYLRISTDGKTLPGDLTVLIEAPTFTSLDADQTNDIEIRDFEEGRSNITMSGNQSLKSLFDCDDLVLRMKGKCKADLRGNGDKIQVRLSDGATLDATRFQLSNATIFASGNSIGRFDIEDEACVESTNSEIQIEGKARIIHSCKEE